MSATDATEVCHRTTRPPIDSHGLATPPRPIPSLPRVPSSLQSHSHVAFAPLPGCSRPCQVKPPAAGRKINEIIAEKEVRNPAPHVPQWQASSRKHAPFSPAPHRLSKRILAGSVNDRKVSSTLLHWPAQPRAGHGAKPAHHRRLGLPYSHSTNPSVLRSLELPPHRATLV